MAHGYRTLQHWNDWLTQHSLGSRLLHAEQHHLSPLLNKQFGKHAILIGVPHQQVLLKASLLPCQFVMSPLLPKHLHTHYIESDLDQLPILTGSVDLVLLPHTLDFVDHARQLLTEACRIVKPEGLLVIFGFNPYSFWGIKRRWEKGKKAPWSGNFIQPYDIKKWLQLADFQLEQQKYFMFSPPIANANIYDKLRFFDIIGNLFFPFFGGVYLILARAKVIPLTPIRLRWKQHLSGIRISTTISGHIARQVRK